MSVWEYKVISSGKGGFATPALMESFLNQLGKEEWEIIHFHTPADNPLAFQGLARRTTQRDWTLEDAAAAAARAEAEKLRAEFEAKFKAAGAGGGAAAGEEKPESLAQQKAESDDGLRRLRDTEHDLDPDAPDAEEAPAAAASSNDPADDWDQLSKEEELPTFFEAMQPLMRRNPRGAGMSVGVDHLAKKWGLSEEDIMGALKECGFSIPDDEDDDPDYVEYDGDLFWVNVNRRGEVWVNTKEKPRPVFKLVKAQKFAPEPKPAEEPITEGAQAETNAEPSAETAGGEPGAEGAAPAAAPRREERHREERGREDRNRDDRGREDRGGRDEGHRRGLPEGAALLERIRPLMRRDRGGQGASGSVGFLSRALKVRENELVQAFEALGLTMGEAGGQAAEITVNHHVWSLHKDQRGGIWITDRRSRGGKEGGRHGEENAGATPAEGDSVFAADAGDAAIPVGRGEEASGPVGPGSDHMTGQGNALSADAEGQSGSGSDAGSSSSSDRAYVGTAEPGGQGSAGLSSEEPAMPAAEVADVARTAADQAAQELVATLRTLLKETRSGSLAGEIGELAANSGKTADELLNLLVGMGLRIPEKARERAVTMEVSGEFVSLTRNAKDEIWLNVKAQGDKRPPRRARRGPAAAEGEEAPEAGEAGSQV